MIIVLLFPLGSVLGSDYVSTVGGFTASSTACCLGKRCSVFSIRQMIWEMKIDDVWEKVFVSLLFEFVLVSSMAMCLSSRHGTLRLEACFGVILEVWCLSGLCEGRRSPSVTYTYKCDSEVYKGISQCAIAMAVGKGCT